jgi:hypothetical protein
MTSNVRRLRFFTRSPFSVLEWGRQKWTSEVWD